MDRETFFPGDRPHLVYEARRPSLSRFDDPDGVPAEPIDVTVKFFNGTDGTLVTFAGGITELDLLSGYVEMTPMDEAEDMGAILTVVVPSEVADNPGNYTMYITTEFDDQLRITTDQRIQISEYR